ncbi:hypothetical protein BH23CHL8_BH23CHL8_12690 [soil metagenome]
MSTRAAADRRGAAERLREILSHPLELVIDGAIAYWLEDDAGHRLSPESSRTIEPFSCPVGAICSFERRIDRVGTVRREEPAAVRALSQGDRQVAPCRRLRSLRQ